MKRESSSETILEREKELSPKSFITSKERSADVIQNINSKLSNFVNCADSFTWIFELPGAKEKEEKLKISEKAKTDFLDYFDENKIWINENLCDEIDSAFEEIRKPYSEFARAFHTSFINGNPVSLEKRKSDSWNQASEHFRNEVPKILKRLQATFRKFLSVKSPDLSDEDQKNVKEAEIEELKTKHFEETLLKLIELHSKKLEGIREQTLRGHDVFEYIKRVVRNRASHPSKIPALVFKEYYTKEMAKGVKLALEKYYQNLESLIDFIKTSDVKNKSRHLKIFNAQFTIDEKLILKLYCDNHLVSANLNELANEFLDIKNLSYDEMKKKT